MKSRTKILLLSAALSVAPLLSYAADPAPATSAPTAPSTAGGKHQAGRTLKQRRAQQQKIVKKLHLSADQRAQLKASRAKTADALKAIRADTNLTSDQKRTKARETLQVARTEMRNLLTPDQLKKWDKLQKHLRKNRGNA